MNQYEEEKLVQDPENVRSAPADYKNTLWKHVDKTRYVLATSFSGGLSRTDMRIASNWIRLLSALATGMKDDDFKEEWEQLDKKDREYVTKGYPKNKSMGESLYQHYEILVLKFETIMELLARKGYMPTERISLDAE